MPRRPGRRTNYSRSPDVYSVWLPFTGNVISEATVCAPKYRVHSRFPIVASSAYTLPSRFRKRGRQRPGGQEAELSTPAVQPFTACGPPQWSHAVSRSQQLSVRRAPSANSRFPENKQISLEALAANAVAERSPIATPAVQTCTAWAHRNGHTLFLVHSSFPMSRPARTPGSP